MSDNIYNIKFPDYVSRIIGRLSDRGYDSYAVGGCVRDTLLGYNPHDWDITTAAHPETVVDIFSDGDIHVIGTAGIRHGTVMVKCGDDVCEITTFRSDGVYEDHRRPDSVSFSDTVEEDLARRDFTMNAIAVKPCGDGVCIADPFDGVRDIKNGVIRTVGDPRLRFTEDALRIMRAVRFSAQLGFAVDADTAQAAIELCDTLSYIAAERITSELWRALCSAGIGRSAEIFREIFEYLVPCGLSKRFLRYVNESCDPYVRLALMLDHGGASDAFFAKMRFPSKTSMLVTRLLAVTDLPESRIDLCRYMRSFGDDFSAFAEYYRILELDGMTNGGMTYRELIAEYDDVIGGGIPYCPKMLDFRGGDAVSLGIPSVHIGEVLEYLLSEVQKGNVPNEKAVLSAAIRRKFKIK